MKSRIEFVLVLVVVCLLAPALYGQETSRVIDMRALVRDTELRLAELYMLSNLAVLPYRITAIAGAYRAALADLQAGVGSHLELAQAAQLAQSVESKAVEFDRAGDVLRRHGQGNAALAALIPRFNRLVLRVAHELNATLYTAAGRFEQDAAAPLPILPGLGRARELRRLDPAGDDYGFLLTQMVRERNRVSHTLADAHEHMDGFLRSFATATHR